MTFVPPRDRVAENSTSNSQTVFAVTGALDPSYNAFSASMSVGDTTLGGVVEAGVAFKTGVLTYSAANQLTVTTAFDSKGTFSAGGTKEVFMGLPGATSLSVDGPLGLSTARKAQGRSNLGLDLVKKNYIINGAMMVSQENGSTSGSATGYYAVDQFITRFSNGGAITAQQVASLTPAGSPNRLRLTVGTADAAVAAGDWLSVQSRIEGYRFADAAYGTASAKTLTLSFGVKAPAGTYCIVFANSADNRSYVAEYTIAAGEANTDVVKAVTIPGDTAGTWLKDNSIGVEVRWGLMAGTTFQQAASAWGAGAGIVGSSNQFNFMGTIGNVFELFDIGLYEGVSAPSFLVPDFSTEVALCQRYFWKTFPMNTRVQQNVGNNNDVLQCNAVAAGIALFTVNLPTRMRVGPAVTTYNPVASNASVRDVTNSADRAATLQVATEGYIAIEFTATTVPCRNCVHASANARM